jgi:allantoicase
VLVGRQAVARPLGRARGSSVLWWRILADPARSDRLAAGYQALRQRRVGDQLVVVGDGPDRADLEAALGDTATFTGFLRTIYLPTLKATLDSARARKGRVVLAVPRSKIEALIEQALA